MEKCVYQKDLPISLFGGKILNTYSYIYTNLSQILGKLYNNSYTKLCIARGPNSGGGGTVGKIKEKLSEIKNNSENIFIWPY